MGSWKKIINSSDGISALNDIDTSGVAQNEVLVYNGTYWEAAPAGTTFNFDIGTFSSTGGNEVDFSGGYLLGGAGADWKTPGFTVVYENVTDTLDSAATITAGVNVHSSDSPYVITVGTSGTPGTVTGGMFGYPTANWGAGGKFQTSWTLSAIEGGVTKTKILYTTWYNMIYRGFHADASPSDTNLKGLTSILTGTYDMGPSTMTNDTGDSAYFHFVYPTRLTALYGAPVFKFNGFTTSMEEVSTTNDIENASLYTEAYTHFRIGPYADGSSFTFECEND